MNAASGLKLHHLILVTDILMAKSRRVASQTLGTTDKHLKLHILKQAHSNNHPDSSTLATA